MKAKPYHLDQWKPLFFTIWTGQAFSLFGSTLVDFALVWYLTTETGSAIVLTTATLAVTLPRILLGPVLGSLVDRLSRRFVIILSDSLIAVITLLVAALFYYDVVQIWHVFVLMLLRAIAGTAHRIAMVSATSLMVPRAQLSRVAGLNHTLFAAMNVLGPPAGAFLLEAIRIYGILLVDILTALIAILPIVFILLPEPARGSSQGGRTTKITLFRDLTDGFRFIKSWKGLMGVIVMSTIAIALISPVFSLTPLLVTRHFNGGAAKLGWLQGVIGAGTIADGLLLSAWGGFKKKILSVIIGGITAGLGIVAASLAPAGMYWLALSGFALMGVASAFVNGPMQALLQTRVVPEMQGRVNGFMGSATQLASPAGLLLIGALAEMIDLRILFFVCGLGTALIHLAAGFVRVIMNIEEEQAALQDLADAC